MVSTYWQKTQKLYKYKKNRYIMRQPGDYSTDDRRNSKIDLYIYIYELQIINSMKDQPIIQ